LPADSIPGREKHMFGKIGLAAALAATAFVSAPSAWSADLGQYAPAPAYAQDSSCPPFGQPKVYYRRMVGAKGPRLVYLNPPPDVYPIYVAPQQAFIVSDSCFNQYRVNWYAGKTFYYDAGTPNRADTFIIHQRY
jgi:hypothetical protein